MGVLVGAWMPTGADCLQKLREYVPYVLVLEPELPDALDERVIESVGDASRPRGHTGVDGAGLRVTKRPSPQKEGEGQITHLEIRTAPPASRLWLGQAMPIVGVSRIPVVLCSQTGCKVTEIAG